MKKLSFCLSILSVSLFAGGESVSSRLSGDANEKTKKIDCRTCMRGCGLGCASTSVSGCGMYVGGAMADSGLLTTAAVVNVGAAVMCCGLLGALVGASCPRDENTVSVSTNVVPVATPMESRTLLSTAFPHDFSQTK